MAKTDKAPAFGDALLEGLREAAAWKRGEVALETVNVDPMPAERVRAIRRKVSKSASDFERRFFSGIPAATLSNWEQGRRTPDPAARILLRVIEKDPEAVLRVLSGGR